MCKFAPFLDLLASSLLTNHRWRLAGRNSRAKRKRVMQDEANSHPSPKFKPINGPADETPTKRQQTTPRSKNTDNSEGSSGKSGGKGSSGKSVMSKKERDYQSVLHSGSRKTQMRSQSRATVFPSMVRPEKCLRCAGEVAQFPDLIYSIDPKSTASKCTDCVKKGKSCEDVSPKLSSLASPLLTSGEVPARLHRLLYELESAAACFTEGHASQKDIDIAQAAFDAEKLRSNHDTKISDAKAQKFPWKPMVQSQEKLGASISSAIVSTNRILVGYLTKEFAVITASFESVIDQLSRLRRVSNLDISSEAPANLRRRIFDLSIPKHLLRKMYMMRAVLRFQSLDTLHLALLLPLRLLN
ncbi:MAG: hypothetical protein CL912_25450 [Deltaproteobacteria bacterium]|nr:hypothetical protein [Deltaproteobacteria bacterium]